MDFSDILLPDATVVGLKSATKMAALQQASRLLAAVTGARPAAIAAALTEREALGTTGFGGGCAIPHGRIPGCGRMHAAVLRLAKPIEWQAVDARPVDLLFALVGPDAPGAEHLKMLARISRALRERSLVAKLRGAADASALWALLAAPVVPTRSAA